MGGSGAPCLASPGRSTPRPYAASSNTWIPAASTKAAMRASRGNGGSSLDTVRGSV
jgi:hypothetical protein